ncbi:AAA family ATPase [Cellulomonas sp. NS3]|uniref:AAA family ATPase n=1 Tax=Cellulomonas sp. NS3 TaxID=2973977 RepID=UPI002162FEFC|nr:AAA family ATPase [Cellulomonas sp. NS3]
MWAAGTRLVIIGGPSGAGKSTIARALRAEPGRGTALVEQDHVRRILLREWDTPGAQRAHDHLTALVTAELTASRRRRIGPAPARPPAGSPSSTAGARRRAR